MGRRTSRELSMKLLYQMEIQKDGIKEQIEGFISENNINGEDREFICELIDGVLKNKRDIDNLIEKNLKGWNIDRISKIDLSILRLAIHEILNRPDIPLSVSINEAIELAKKYSTEESGAFINGVLGKIAEHAPVTKREKRHS